MKKMLNGKILPIIINPNPILRKVSRDLAPEELTSNKIEQLWLDMEKTMREKDGAGLAAPQIGENLRMAVLNRNGDTIFLANPKITKKSWAKQTEPEGCLSVLDEKGEIIYAPIERCKRVTCIYLDRNGKKKKIQAEEHLFARALQHEIDHLDGILFIDYLKSSDNNPKKTAIKKIGAK